MITFLYNMGSSTVLHAIVNTAVTAGLLSINCAPAIAKHFMTDLTQTKAMSFKGKAWTSLTELMQMLISCRGGHEYSAKHKPLRSCLPRPPSKMSMFALSEKDDSGSEG